MQQGIPKNIYNKHILELYKSPENYGKLKEPTHSATEKNSNCGDEIKIELKIKKSKIKDAKFSGSGCVLSIVSASMLINKIKGQDLDKIKRFNNKDILKLTDTNKNSSRIKCALLAWNAVKKALRNGKKKTK